MQKLDARIQYRDKRNLLTPDRVTQHSKEIFRLFFAQFNLEKYTCVHFFKTIARMKEVDTKHFEEVVFTKHPNLTLATSVSDINTTLLTHYSIDKNTSYKENLFKIPEPINGKKISVKDIDLVLVPLLAFDKEGHRVGYGKGYYDRFLRELKDDCIKVGVNFFDPIDRIDDCDDFDVALDFCITPQKVYSF